MSSLHEGSLERLQDIHQGGEISDEHTHVAGRFVCFDTSNSRATHAVRMHQHHCLMIIQLNQIVLPLPVDLLRIKKLDVLLRGAYPMDQLEEET